MKVFANWLCAKVKGALAGRRNRKLSRAESDDRGSVRVVLCRLEGSDDKGAAAVNHAFKSIGGVELIEDDRVVRADGAKDEWEPAMRSQAQEIMMSRGADLAIVGCVRKPNKLLSLWIVRRSGEGTLSRGDHVYRIRKAMLGEDFLNDLRAQILAVHESHTGEKHQGAEVLSLRAPLDNDDKKDIEKPPLRRPTDLDAVSSGVPYDSVASTLAATARCQPASFAAAAAKERENEQRKFMDRLAGIGTVAQLARADSAARVAAKLHEASRCARVDSAASEIAKLHEASRCARVDDAFTGAAARLAQTSSIADEMAKLREAERRERMDAFTGAAARLAQASSISVRPVGQVQG